MRPPHSRGTIKRRRTLAALLVVTTAVVAFGAGATVVMARRGDPVETAFVISGQAARSVSVQCPSPSLGGTLPAVVFLPAGYSNRGRRYPVVYFLHGLPANPTSYESNSFVAGAVASTHIRAIVVTPQGARSENSDREYLDWSPTENWPRAMSHDLTHCIDARYHTIRNRFGRALMGLSAGGYGAMNIGLRSLQTFAAVESWSGYFIATNPAGTAVLHFGSAAARANATVPRGGPLIRSLSTWPSLVAFYVGNQDSRFLQMNRRYDASLTASDIPHTFRVYQGGHSPALWSSEAPHWIAMALRWMTSKAHERDRDGGATLGAS